MSEISEHTGGLWYRKVGSGGHRWGTTEEEVELGSTRAVRGSDSGSKVDEVTGGQVRGLEDGELTGDDIIDTRVGVCRGDSCKETIDGENAYSDIRNWSSVLLKAKIEPSAPPPL